MYAILLSGLFSFLGSLLRAIVIKFVIFTALFLIVSGFITYLSTKLPDASSLTTGFGALSNSVWYFFDFFAIPFGLPLLLSAYVLRFMIRRIPVIG